MTSCMGLDREAYPLLALALIMLSATNTRSMTSYRMRVHAAASRNSKSVTIVTTSLIIPAFSWWYLTRIDTGSHEEMKLQHPHGAHGGATTQAEEGEVGVQGRP